MTPPTEARIGRLKEVIEHVSRLLPAQGPITVFIHHNTLHAFEDLPFDEAVKLGGQVFGCQPYLSEDRYREKLLRGRITVDDLSAYRTAREPPCQKQALNRRKVMRKARSKKQRPKLLAELERRYRETPNF